jgi:serine/threonine protein kinase
VSRLSDAVVEHLCLVADYPDLSGTKYDLIEKIGQGGMGCVYLVHDRLLDRPVALKVLSDSSAGPQAAERLTEEARIIARLEHPGIVPVHDSGVLADGRVYYAMKHVRGKRLDEYAGPATSLTEILQILRKVCESVAFAHAHDVIHRDLKPQNIMVGSFGEVLVMDWGVAKTLGDQSPPRPTAEPRAAHNDATPPATAHGTVLGTPGYMAPEQASGEIGRLDERTDVYALGAVLYFLLTGRPPALPLNRAGDAQAHAELEPPWRLRRSTPRALEAICLKALAVLPEDRYPSVSRMSDDIGRFLAAERVEAYSEGVLGAARRLGSKYRTAIVLVLAYLVVRILLILFNRT